MDYNETLEYLFNSLPMFSRIGASAYKEGLENTLALDEHFGHPHQQFKTIHVAGTNGKGSVSHLLAATLQQAGYKTGLYTSPHLVDFRERIRVNGEMISKQFVQDFVADNYAFFEQLHPSFFEMSVLMAFDYFALNNVDVAIIEVGLGGRLDSTNIISPELSVITNISLDHTGFLGDTPVKIAAEKAGIIKPDIPVVIGEANGDVKQLFIDKAAMVHAPIYFAEECYEVKSELTVPVDHRFRTYAYTSIKDSNKTGYVNVGLLGDYQRKNLATVLTAVEVLNKNGFRIDENDFQTACEQVVSLTGLQGRWQVISEEPLTIFDIGHNEAGIRAVTEQLKTIPYNKLHIVIGMVNDKDISTVLSLLPREAVYYFTKADIPRAMSENELKTQGAMQHLMGESYPTVAEAYKAAQTAAQKNDVIFVGGSNFVVAEALLDV